MRALVVIVAVACLAASISITVIAIFFGPEVEGSRFVVPGQATVTLEARKYNLWSRFEGIEGTGGRGCSDTARALQSGAGLRGSGGVLVAPQPRRACSTANAGDVAKTSTMNFEVPAAGSYRFIAMGAPPSGSVEMWLAPSRSLVLLIGGPLVLFLAGLTLVILRFTALRRRPAQTGSPTKP
jgi:hypothetical protein